MAGLSLVNMNLVSHYALGFEVLRPICAGKLTFPVVSRIPRIVRSTVFDTT